MSNYSRKTTGEILYKGIPMTYQEIVLKLNHYAELEAENKALRKLLESHCKTLEARYDASDDAADYEVWQSWLGKISQKKI